MNRIVALFLVLPILSMAQSKYLTKSGTLDFQASVPSFEEIKATNTNVTAIFNSTNGEFAALALVKGFRFKNALMEEHFNESYAESNQFPKALFKGKLQNYDPSTPTKDYTLGGILEFHGIQKDLKNVNVKLKKNSETSLNFSGRFTINPEDFDVDIPKIVRNKIAEQVIVTFNFTLNKKSD